MKQNIRQIDDCVILYRDDRTGIAWVEDGSTGNGHSAHPNIDASGSVRGMKSAGYWGKNDRAVRTNGFIYNIEMVRVDDGYDKIAQQACRCQACMERREQNLKWTRATDASPEPRELVLVKLTNEDRLYPYLLGSKDAGYWQIQPAYTGWYTIKEEHEDIILWRRFDDG